MENDPDDAPTTADQQSCPDCAELATVSNEVGLCEHCGRVFVAAPEEMLSRDSPLDVLVVPAVSAQPKTEHPYRAEGPDEGKLQLLVSHKARPFMARKISLAVAAFALAFRLEISLVARLAIAGVGIALLAWALVPRVRRFQFVANPDGLSAGPEGVPQHRCRRFVGDDIEGVVARAMVRTDDPADQRFQIAILDSAGHSHILVDGLEGSERVAWIATKLEHTLGFEEERGTVS